jgi:hypothetical protein
VKHAMVFRVTILGLCTAAVVSCSNPYDPGQRAVGGGLIGAGGGAAVGGLLGGGKGAVAGGLLGGAAGGGAGYATTPTPPRRDYYGY